MILGKAQDIIQALTWRHPAQYVWEADINSRYFVRSNVDPNLRDPLTYGVCDRNQGNNACIQYLAADFRNRLAAGQWNLPGNPGITLQQQQTAPPVPTPQQPVTDPLNNESTGSSLSSLFSGNTMLYIYAAAAAVVIYIFIKK